ncbi:MAG: hypothetical protein A3B74_01175 [Candidatus Kerfeldbacteria bacterium RIFCSPHIGHO2_02_FULL_42_14]|uniref:Right handed beta helix domain-containing protein n=1 Tax=Candidatus Kerfeldbacteria bacterium RIFCSPHIGHO2_02_FULL_42_14 TaxID=1798540 RepID=A0A1G2ARC0_9BACT|nr:MAG: hypothetical protein A3B74_01175 [Candidatus Kerfeldbacteria bacterium RIFCSPHIGHO2_02_FULL_42_14]OGY81962.1 MAG: hypothetical protein A3E60_01260 [Candidatus Kerfeldbacteria bacterium RIFCSPHIGHO2_12_FULL_42_13]OGY83404.1 MAG: hypothetical protein A3I91_02000 [Candidatus Kerfeldbacteria bacterium RIFCSPLOWO2_02_FULL_42_19]
MPNKKLPSPITTKSQTKVAAEKIIITVAISAATLAIGGGIAAGFIGGYTKNTPVISDLISKKLTDKRCNDVDNDKVCDSIDNCPNVANPDQNDRDGDRVGDACDTIDGPNKCIVNPKDEYRMVPCEYQTVQAAIDAARETEIVWIDTKEDGTAYRECIVVDNKQTTTIQGNSQNHPTIKTPENESCTTVTLHDTIEVNVKNLNIDGGRESSAMRLINARSNIYNSKFEAWNPNSNATLILEGNSYAYPRDSEITGTYGVILKDTSHFFPRNVDIIGGSGAITMYGDTYMRTSRTRVKEGGIELQDRSGMDMMNLDIDYADIGIETNTSGIIELINSTIEGNRVGIQCTENCGGRVQISHSIITGGETPMQNINYPDFNDGRTSLLWSPNGTCSDLCNDPDVLWGNPDFIGDTHVPGSKSPTIDKAEDGPEIDVRNFPRPVDGNNDGNAKYDLGAYEFTPDQDR